MTPKLGKECLAEFIGTYLLVLTIGFNVMSGQSTWAVLSIASVLMVSIYALASVSGANFNPAVTLTLYLTKAETDLTKVGAYMATQIVAGICAGMTSLAVFGDAIPLQPGKGHGVAGAAAVEILYTFAGPAVQISNSHRNLRIGIGIFACPNSQIPIQIPDFQRFVLGCIQVKFCK